MSAEICLSSRGIELKINFLKRIVEFPLTYKNEPTININSNKQNSCVHFQDILYKKTLNVV